MRSFEQHLNEFRARGVEVAAISVDSREESRKLAQDRGYTFTLLSDPKAEVIRRYGLIHAGAGEQGRDVARPAEVLIDAQGTVRWVNLTEDLQVRARPLTVLRVIDSWTPARAGKQVKSASMPLG